MKRFVLLLGLCLFPAGSAWAQSTGQITGTVTSDAGAPLSGVAVAVTGTSRGADTELDGTYTITGVPAGSHEVRATRIGYGETTAQVTVAAGQTATLNIQMTPQALSLEGVVAVGYGTMEKRDVTGAVASVSTAEITQIPTPSTGEALKGRVPGLTVQTNSYQPGADPEIRIRGVRSLEASNDPLIVVDGVPIAGGLGDINQASIQSIDVLKDASATAVYGSRGANGVILITTKQGRPGDIQVTYNTYYGVQQIHNLVDIMDGPQYAQFNRDASRADGTYGCPEDVIQCDAGDEALFTAIELESIRTGFSQDWIDPISRDGSIQSHSVGVTGGSENIRFAVTANYLDEKGVTIGQAYVRRGVTGSVSHSGRFQTGLSVNVNNSLRNENRGGGTWGEAMTIDPLAPAFDENGDPIVNATPWDSQMFNPIVDVANRKHDHLRTRTFGNAYAGYDLMDGLNLKTTFGADLLFRREGEFIGNATDSYHAKGDANDAHLEREETFNWVSTTQLQFNRQVSENQNVDATLLYEVQKETNDFSEASVINLPYDYQLYYNLGSAGGVSGVDSNYEQWLLQSVMGRVNYTLMDRYYLTLTGRQDCSSRLAPGNKCALFPSASVKWRLSDEGFMQGQSLFNDLSLQFSYGRTGNTSIDPYQTQGSLDRTTYSFAGSGAFGFRPSEIANSELTWENTDQYNIGLEFGLFNSRIIGTVDGYVQTTHDLLLERQLPPSSGFDDVLQNVGSTRNSGIEVALSTINLQNWHGLSWSSDLAWSKNKNEIVSLFGGTADDIGNGWFIGYPTEVHYLYEFDGIWQADEAAEAESYDRRVGDIKVVDQNGDGQITADADQVIVGRHEDYPSWIGSFSNRLTFHDFDLSGLITARWGYLVDSGTWPGQMSGRYNEPDLNYWTPRNPSNEFPRAHKASEGAIDDDAVQLFDGSNWRVRNITLGYTVPTSLTSRLSQGASLRIYAQAQDPFVFTDFPGFDPDGAADNEVPSYRTLLLGATVGF